MRYLIEYTTSQSAGRFWVDAKNFREALARITPTLQGLHCTSADLLDTPDERAGFGQGAILASYTGSGDWTIRSAGAAEQM